MHLGTFPSVRLSFVLVGRSDGRQQCINGITASNDVGCRASAYSDDLVLLVVQGASTI